MQKIIYVYDNNLKEVNVLLKEGWKIVSVNTVPVTEKYYSIVAYIVLEKSESNFNNKYTSINRNVALKEFYDPEVIV